METTSQASLDRPSLLSLPPILDLKAAAPLRDALLALRGNDVTLDGAEVQRLGGQCLQVLLAARAAWETDGYRFEIHGPSSDLADALTLMGAGYLILEQELA
jgi:chemotaxis protein CheX